MFCTFKSLFMAVPGLCCCGFSLVGASQGLLWAAARGVLIAAASLVESTGSGCSGFSTDSTWAQWLGGICVMWNLPGPGIKPTSPALAGRFLTCQRGGFFLVCFLQLHRVP